jgi:hypothetical protein
MRWIAASLDPENDPALDAGFHPRPAQSPHTAREHAEWMQAHAPTMPYTAHLLALVHAMDGRSPEAIAVLRTIEAMTFDAHLTFHLSEAYAMAGDTPNALRMLSDSVERGFHPGAFIAEHCPFLTPLRGDARFERIAARAAHRVAEFRA